MPSNSNQPTNGPPNENPGFSELGAGQQLARWNNAVHSFLIGDTPAAAALLCSYVSGTTNPNSPQVSSTGIFSATRADLSFARYALAVDSPERSRIDRLLGLGGKALDPVTELFFKVDLLLREARAVKLFEREAISPHLLFEIYRAQKQLLDVFELQEESDYLKAAKILLEVQKAFVGSIENLAFADDFEEEPGEIFFEVRQSLVDALESDHSLNIHGHFVTNIALWCAEIAYSQTRLCAEQRRQDLLDEAMEWGQLAYRMLLPQADGLLMAGKLMEFSAPCSQKASTTSLTYPVLGSDGKKIFWRTIERAVTPEELHHDLVVTTSLLRRVAAAAAENAAPQLAEELHSKATFYAEFTIQSACKVLSAIKPELSDAFSVFGAPNSRSRPVEFNLVEGRSEFESQLAELYAEGYGDLIDSLHHSAHYLQRDPALVEQLSEGTYLAHEYVHSASAFDTIGDEAIQVTQYLAGDYSAFAKTEPQDFVSRRKNISLCYLGFCSLRDRREYRQALELLEEMLPHLEQSSKFVQALSFDQVILYMKTDQPKRAQELFSSLCPQNEPAELVDCALQVKALRCKALIGAYAANDASSPEDKLGLLREVHNQFLTALVLNCNMHATTVSEAVETTIELSEAALMIATLEKDPELRERAIASAEARAYRVSSILWEKDDPFFYLGRHVFRDSPSVAPRDAASPSYKFVFCMELWILELRLANFRLKSEPLPDRRERIIGNLLDLLGSKTWVDNQKQPLSNLLLTDLGQANAAQNVDLGGILNGLVQNGRGHLIQQLKCWIELYLDYDSHFSGDFDYVYADEYLDRQLRPTELKSFSRKLESLKALLEPIS
jgi:hypothetical protein